MKTTIHIIILILLLALSAAYCAYYFDGYDGNSDGNIYASLARNIAEGKGFSLENVTPLGLTFNSQIPQPNNIHAPIYALYLSLWFCLFGAGDFIALCASIAALGLLIVSGYLLGRKIGGDWIAIITAMLIGTSQITLSAVIGGSPEILAGALIAFSVYVLLSSQKKYALILSGIFFGMAILTRYHLVIIGIPLAILFLENYSRNLFIWLLAVLLAIAPWLIRNWIVLGNPLFTLQCYGEFARGLSRFGDPDYVYRSFTPMPLGYIITHYPLDWAAKAFSGMIYFAKSFPIYFNYLGIVPFFFGLYKIGNFQGDQRKVVLLTFLGAVLIMVLGALDGHDSSHLASLQPLFAISTLLGGVVFSRAMGFYRFKIVVAVAALIMFLPARYPYQETELKMTTVKSEVDREAYVEISRIVAPGEEVVTDVPASICWYARRKAIWLPINYDDFKTLMNRPDCRYLYINDPVTFMNKRTDRELGDFGVSFRSVRGFNGPGRLYILYNEQSETTM
jgi:4-amino-4-deoxy-L-arabinose transferase-like glycosyltransferase